MKTPITHSLLAHDPRFAMCHRHRMLRLEGLEPRAMYSADLQNGLLTVMGTNRSDTILVALDPQVGQLDVNVNGQHSIFQVADVGHLAVVGKNGNDKITIAADVLIDVSLYGGNGNDTLLAGGGNDFVQGGNGKDYLHGGAGDDTLYGGNGNDKLNGGEGNDALDGGNGNDSCLGEWGDDRLQGGRGNDWLDGGDGTNWLDSGAGQNKRRNGVFVRLDGQFNVY